jgi:hypothetical protein
MTTFLRKDLILELDGGGARGLIASDRALDVE